ncbi:MAG: hypothetical protein WC299_04175 [Kiritimatiellia bacterium]
MPFTAYCLDHGNFTVIPRQMRDSFRDMRSCGFDGVALSFSESEMRYSRRAFEIQVACAHECGLKVHVIPSRIGGRFAGAPLLYCNWLVEHPSSQTPENPAMACIQDAEFRKWAHEYIHTLFADYELNGLIWDEPKSSMVLTRHPATTAKFGPDPTPENMADDFALFIEEMTATARAARPDIAVTLFNMPSVNAFFTSRCAHIKGLNYLGFDGACCRQSYFREPPRKLKHYFSETWDRTRSECAAGGKKTFALVENFMVPEGLVPELREGLAAFLRQAKPDHLSCYYYGLNNAEPEKVHATVIEIIREHYLVQRPVKS